MAGFKVGYTFSCGDVPTNGRGHRPIDGAHIATVLGPSKRLASLVDVRCTCGHEWMVPTEILSGAF